MAQENSGLGCRQICWLVGLVAGIVLTVLLHEAGAQSWVVSLGAGIVLCVLAGLIVTNFFCGEAAPAAVVPHPAPAAKPAAAPEKSAPVKSAPVKSMPVAKTEKAAAAPVVADGEPETLAAPRGGKADDLKQLKGVGPALEKKLNGLGIYHFDQIAGWDEKEIEWVDDQLRFKGRIARDEWTKQAGILATGGTTEFSARVKKGDA